MTSVKAEAIRQIDDNKEALIALSNAVWGFAELSLKEYDSALAYKEALEKEGFAVQMPFSGVETAVYGRFGSGKPDVGLLAEYDALAGLSQQGGAETEAPLPGKDAGHGCGHNLLGAGAFGAALAVKRYLEKTGCSGTVHFFGCPGEEGCASKAYFAKQNVWKQLDAALTWHPDDCNEVATGSCMACIQTEYSFTGRAAHAAGCPEMGRSALDAVELMNVGVQFLREHMPKSASVHYAIINAGGSSPNVVQPRASVLYMVREKDIQAAAALQKRVDAIAKGAAMMSETSVSFRLVDSCANVVPNKAFEALLQKCFSEQGVPQYTPQEWDYAKALRSTYEQGFPSGTGARNDALIREAVAQQTQNGTRALNDFLMPAFFTTAMEPGSTDVGDVSWQVPTVQLHSLCFPAGCPGHSWQNVACGATSIAHKGMLNAARVLAAAAIAIIDQPKLLQPIQQEFSVSTAVGYINPMPEDFVLTAV